MEDGVIFLLLTMGEFIISVPLTLTIKLGVQLQNDTRAIGVFVKVMLPESRLK